MATMCGGVSADQTISDDHINKAKEAHLLMDDSKDYEFIELQSVKTQVVAGIKYIFVFTRKSKSDGKTQRCNVSLWEQPWMPNPEDKQKLVEQKVEDI